MEEGTGMTTAQVGYTPVHRWVKQVLSSMHLTVVGTVAWAVLCLLVAQRVTPAALARALPGEHAGSGRSRLRRVRRWWRGPALDQTRMRPALIRLALPLLAGDQSVVVALDTTRLGPWEVWLAGIVVAGRTLPIGWAVLPYPWPKGRFCVTTLALMQQLQQAFPVGVRWTLVADRGFPSARLFAHLRQGGTSFSVRLRLTDWVTVARVYATVATHLEAGRLGTGSGRRRRWAVGDLISRSCQAGSWSARLWRRRPNISATPARSASGPSGPWRMPSIGSISRAVRRGHPVRRPSAMPRPGSYSLPHRRSHRRWRSMPGGCRSRKRTAIGIITGRYGPPWSTCQPRPWWRG